MCSLMPDGFLFVISTFSFLPPAERWYLSWATHLSAHDDGLIPGHWHPAISVSLACTASDGAGQPPGNYVHHLFAVPGSHSCFGGSILCFCTALTQGNAAPLHSRKEKGSRSYPHSAWPEGAIEFGGEGARYHRGRVKWMPCVNKGK